jgi:hypothetical protein
MPVIDRLPLWFRVRWLVLAAGIALVGLAIGWFATRAGDRSAAARCVQLYARARSLPDSQDVDRYIVPEIRTREVPAGGVTCGVLRGLGRLK